MTKTLRSQQRIRQQIGFSHFLQRFLFEEQAEGIETALLIVLVTIFAAGLALQMERFGADAAQTLDRAQQYSVQSMGTRAQGETAAAYAWSDVYRQWLEWDSRAKLAQAEGDEAAASRYQAVRDRAQGLTPLLGSTFFDPHSGQPPNLRAYEAETYLIEATELQERYLRSMAVYEVLDGKSDTIGLLIVLLGIAVALFALSPNEQLLPSRRLRLIPMAGGGLLTLYVAATAGSVLLEPLPAYTQEAPSFYAQGVGLAYQGAHGLAVDAFNQALAYEPDYADAFFRRGNAHFALSDFQAAAADYQAARNSGREDVQVLWNLGWVSYVLGDLPASIEYSQQALDYDNSQVALYFNLGAAYLANGAISAAQSAYNTGLTLAANSVISETAQESSVTPAMWAYLTIAIGDLDRLNTCLRSQVCTETPPYERLVDPQITQAAASELEETLKNTAVALEYARQLPPAQVRGQISIPEFGTSTDSVANDSTGFTPFGADMPPMRFGLALEEESNRTIDETLVSALPGDPSVAVRFTFSDLTDGQLFVMKVYRNGVEAPWLRLVQNWTLGSAGEAVLPLSPSSQFSLTDGDYKVEFYLDGRLVQKGRFELGAS